MKANILTHPNLHPSLAQPPAKPLPPSVMAGIIIWGGLIAFLALLGIFDAPPSRPPLSILLAVLLPVAGFGIVTGVSRRFRVWLLKLDERPIILLHTWRMLGLGFVFLYFRGQLPASFALTAGLGDAIAAIGAFFLGVRLFQNGAVSRRRKLIWNTFGLLDFVAAIALGVVTRQWWNGGISSSAMGQFPLALIPGFAVPFFILTHLILYLKWRRV